jgi:hypothetical protein
MLKSNKLHPKLNGYTIRDFLESYASINEDLFITDGFKVKLSGVETDQSDGKQKKVCIIKNYIKLDVTLTKQQEHALKTYIYKSLLDFIDNPLDNKIKYLRVCDLEDIHINQKSEQQIHFKFYTKLMALSTNDTYIISGDTVTLNENGIYYYGRLKVLSSKQAVVSIRGFNEERTFDIPLDASKVLQEDLITYIKRLFNPEEVEAFVEYINNQPEEERAIIEQDIETIRYRYDITEDMKLNLIQARTGGGKFRKDVLKLWGKKCILTGFELEEGIDACHIKPWAIASDIERLDKYNGIPISKTYHAIFDKGYFSFDDEGKPIYAKTITDKYKKGLKLPDKLPKALNKKQKEYFRYRTEHILIKEL